MAAIKKQAEFTIIKSRRGRDHEYKGTLAALIEMFKYTLECGRSYQHEKGNKKINLEPKGIKSLVTNINNAESNSAMNGYSENYYSLKEEA